MTQAYTAIYICFALLQFMRVIEADRHACQKPPREIGALYMVYPDSGTKKHLIICLLAVQHDNGFHAAAARTLSRSLALYFSRPVRLFRPAKGIVSRKLYFYKH